MSGPLLVAHRAGNDPGTLRAALELGADLVEADIHAYRGRLEVRHRKTLGPWWLWDRGEFARRRDAEVFEVDQLLAAAGGDPRLMLDLKGIHPRLAPRLARALTAVPDLRVTICTQHWWMLAAFQDAANVRLVLSAGSRRGLRRLRSRLRRRPAYGACVHRRLLTPETVTELRRSTDVVFTWPVDTAADIADARRLGVDAVIGKDLGVLRP
ncbi:glycerophosphodiester phosphodiesterase [Kribbella sp. NPDC051586]|uniref:glycerophosphodiester phosphodiesterase n=1 Tax=Kribbella sp. NPDC051586 TaxID=3364118 RepID=UPI0037983407